MISLAGMERVVFHSEKKVLFEIAFDILIFCCYCCFFLPSVEGFACVCCSAAIITAYLMRTERLSVEGVNTENETVTVFRVF